MHDPSALAWIVVLAYAVGALLGFVAARSAAAGRDRTFWYAAAAVLLFLGLNKQLDLQMLLGELARSMARENGWYGARRMVQGIFLLLLALGTGVAGVALAVWLRRAAAPVKLAAAGVLLVAAFVLMRAAAFHHIDAWVTVDVAGLRSGWWLELAGIGLIAGSAAFSIRRNGARTPSAAVGRDRA